MLYVYFANLVLSYIAYFKKALSASGGVAAALLGTGIIWGTGLEGYLLMGSFFVSSTLLTKYSAYRNKSLKLHELHEKMDVRDFTQVLSNGVIPLTFSLLYGLWPYQPFYIGFVTALAVATSDTWASEIGVFSSRKPRTLIGKKELRPGLSGGVTKLGLVASFLGSGFIAAFYGFLVCLRQMQGASFGNLFQWSFLFPLILNLILVTTLGFMGSLLDSLLGERFQAKYKTKDPVGIITEKVFHVNSSSGTVAKNEWVSGIPWLNNNLVNLLSVAFISLLGFLASQLLFHFF